MKRLTFHGPGLLEVPGFFTIGPGEHEDLDGDFADALVAANPDIDMTVTDIGKAARSAATAPPSGGAQPEAQQGEGQSTARDPKE